MSRSSGTEDFDAHLRKTIGAGLRRSRKKLGLTQEDASEELGVTSEYYARLERGHALPSVPVLYLLVITLRISAAELLGLADPADSDSALRAPVARVSPNKPGPLPPPVKRIVKRLDGAPPDRVRLVIMLVKELEERFAASEADASG